MVRELSQIAENAMLQIAGHTPEQILAWRNAGTVPYSEYEKIAMRAGTVYESWLWLGDQVGKGHRRD